MLHVEKQVELEISIKFTAAIIFDKPLIVYPAKKKWRKGSLTY